jgi:hypothetical protein
MKNFKFLLIVLSIGLFSLGSCTNDTSSGTDTEQEATTSIALRTVLNSIKNNDASATGRVADNNPSDQQDDFCFDFVYPITLEYNTGATVTVDDFNGLIEVLMDETNDVYIEGIVFPFDIVLLADGTTVTINSEEDFIEALMACDNFDVWDDDDVIIDCFDFVYPIDLIAADGSTVTVNSDDELIAFFEAQGMYYEPNFVFPLDVTTIDGEQLTIDSLYDLFDLMDDCYAYDGWEDDCQCTDEYEPVCVYDATSDMTIPFPNECIAECCGFTEADFVDCGDLFEEVFFMDYVGACFDFVYPIQVTFNGTTMDVYAFAGLEQFFAPGNATELVFPLEITVTATSETITINSLEELEDFIRDNC